jgi:hypothetical protein
MYDPNKIADAASTIKDMLVQNLDTLTGKEPVWGVISAVYFPASEGAGVTSVDYGSPPEEADIDAEKIKAYTLGTDVFWGVDCDRTGAHVECLFLSRQIPIVLVVWMVEGALDSTALNAAIDSAVADAIHLYDTALMRRPL